MAADIFPLLRRSVTHGDDPYSDPDVEVIDPDDDGDDDRSHDARLNPDADEDDGDEIGQDKNRFDDNIADELPDDLLEKIGHDLFGLIKDDYDSSDEWRQGIEKGLKLLGVKLEEVQEPFPGACGASHPLLMEAVTQFQARAIGELFPSEGPVKTRILGRQTHERIQQAQRVREYLNFQVTEEMVEYFPELDQLLMWVPLSGSAFTKVYFDPLLARPVMRAISVDDFIVDYEATDIYSASRVTQVVRLYQNDLKKLMKRKIFRDVKLIDPALEDDRIVKPQVDEMEGRDRVEAEATRKYTLYECHCTLDLEGHDKEADEDDIELPYIVVMDKDTKEILSVRRNWEETDPAKKRINWFQHWKFLPGLGFYGFGLIHLLGNLTKSATAALRILVDSGMYSTLPGGFKSRGARLQGGDDPIRFGEWRDLDGAGDDIRKNIIPLPTKEPSATLFQLLGAVVEDGRRLASITDINVGDSNQENPVGTTLALLEQGVRVMTAVHKRLHRAQGEVLKALKRIDRDNMPEVYPYEIEGETKEIRNSDFARSIDVLPVSDPNIFSETQRIMRAQAQLQLAQQFPAQHNQYEALYRMHEVLGTPDIEKVLVPPKGPKPMDPITEEFAVMHGQPVMAYPWQDHKAHLASHQAWMQNPQLGGNPMIQQLVGPAMMSHIADHLAHEHRLEIQAAIGQELPPPPHYNPANPNADDGWQPLPPELENRIAEMAAGPAQSIAKNAQIAQQAQQNKALMQSPEFQLKMRELDIKQQEANTKAQEAQNDIVLQQQQHQMTMQQEAAKLQGLQQKNQLEAEKARLMTQLRAVEHRLKLATQAEAHQQKIAHQQQEHVVGIQQRVNDANIDRVNRAADATQDRMNTQADAHLDLGIKQAEFEQEYQHAEEMQDLELRQKQEEHKMDLEKQQELADNQIRVEKEKAQALKRAKIDTVEMGGGGGGGSGGKSGGTSKSKGAKK
jgi:hypothetical protein